MANTKLHGKPRLSKNLEDYSSPEEYSGQGNTRIVRDLMFSYTAEYKDPAGASVLEPVDVMRGTELGVDEMGLLALEKGERHHSFYTDAERKTLESGGDPSKPASLSEESVSEMGEFELSEYIGGNNPTGKALNVDETVALAGTDKDLAHRLLQAENVATDGDPRKGVEAGLTAIIEG
jgi:hypothetical protein